MNHDHAYKLLFSHPEMVEDLLRGFVHQDWIAQLDFSTLEKCNGSYVSDHLRSREEDVVWRIRLRDEWLYVYLLLEFQSRPDRWMALRMLVYVGLLYQDLVRTKQLTQDGRLPPVLPLVLYNGTSAWKAPLELEPLLAAAPGELGQYRPRLRYLLLDEGHLQISRDPALRNLAAALFRLEQGRSAEEILQVIHALGVWLQAPEQSSLRNAFMEWIKQELPPDRFSGLDFSQTHDLRRAETMLAERVKQWTQEWKQQGLQEGLREGRQKGRQEGRQEGLQQGLRNGLKEGRQQAQRDIARALLDIVSDDALLSARTGVPVEEIAAMRREPGNSPLP